MRDETDVERLMHIERRLQIAARRRVVIELALALDDRHRTKRLDDRSPRPPFVIDGRRDFAFAEGRHDLPQLMKRKVPS